MTLKNGKPESFGRERELCLQWLVLACNLPFFSVSNNFPGLLKTSQGFFNPFVFVGWYTQCFNQGCQAPGFVLLASITQQPVIEAYMSISTALVVLVGFSFVVSSLSSHYAPVCSGIYLVRVCEILCPQALILLQCE